MKRNNLRTMAVAAIAILAGYNVYLAQPKTNNEMSDVLIANVEALSQNEENGGGGEAVLTCSAKCNDGIGKCWLKSSGNFCVFSGSHSDNCTGYGCMKYDGTIYY